VSRRALCRAALGALAALAGGTAAAREPEAAAEPPIEGAIWQLREYRTGAGLRPAAPGDGHLYTLFDDGRFMINAGCGTLQGRYWLEGGAMLFSPHVESLLDDCPDILRAQEQAVLDLLRMVDRAAVADGRVSLNDHAGRPLLILAPPDRAPLQGRTWVLKAYRGADGIVVRALDAPAFTLLFEDAGNISGSACDGYRAVYQRSDRFLRLVGPVAVSRIGCANEDAASQGADYIAMLSQVDSYRVDTETLLLRDENGRMLAHFVPADDAEPVANGLFGPARGADNLPPAPVPLLPFVDR
jgi:heat shock protein HslJ